MFLLAWTSVFLPTVSNNPFPVRGCGRGKESWESRANSFKAILSWEYYKTHIGLWFPYAWRGVRGWGNVIIPWRDLPLNDELGDYARYRLKNVWQRRFRQMCSVAGHFRHFPTACTKVILKLEMQFLMACGMLCDASVRDATAQLCYAPIIPIRARISGS